MELHKNRLYRFVHDPERAAIKFVWSAETARMSDDEFKDALSNFAGFAAEFAASNLMVDLREFRHELSPEAGAWRDEAVTPRYNKAGVRKFAYILATERLPPEDAPPPSSPQERFQTRFFDAESEAEAWFAEG